MGFVQVSTKQVQEISNFERYPSTHIVCDTMGFGLSPAHFKKKSARYSSWLTGLFQESIQMVADHIGFSDVLNCEYGKSDHPELLLDSRPQQADLNLVVELTK